MNGDLDRDQLIAEAEASLAEGAPAPAAAAWLEAVVHGNLASVWPVTAPELRETIVRAFAGDDYPPALQPSVDELLGDTGPACPLWPLFAERFADYARKLVLDPDSLGIATRPRVEGLDLEWVFFVPSHDGRPEIVTEPRLVEGVALLLRRSEGRWQVAGIAGG